MRFICFLASSFLVTFFGYSSAHAASLGCFNGPYANKLLILSELNNSYVGHIVDGKTEDGGYKIRSSMKMVPLNQELEHMLMWIGQNGLESEGFCITGSRATAGEEKFFFIHTLRKYSEQ